MTEVGKARQPWAVSTPHVAASNAAARVFERGGSAVDAAIAAAAMLTVVYPNQCSLGGDLIALIGTPDGRVQTINASGRAPAGLDVAAFTRNHTEMPVYGPHPVTVPGVISGWEALHSRWGTIPFHDLLSGAIRAADGGVPVAPGLARAIERETVRIGADPGLRATFMRGDEYLSEGQLLAQPELAVSLARIAADGAEAMYRGVIGQAIVESLRGLGSAMTHDDFAHHTVTVTAPQGVVFAGTEYLAPGGNSQGTYYLAGLAALERLRAAGGALDPLGKSAGRIATILARAAHHRDQALGGATHPAHGTLSESLIGDILRPTLAGTLPTAAPVARGDTAAVVTVDGNGLWVSLLESVFHTFGSGILEPTTGIVLQNRGASFNLRLGAARQLAPGRRPPHTLMPVMLRDEGRITGCIAVMGGRAQPQIQTEVAMALTADASLVDAVSRPRWVLGALDAGHPESAAQTAQAEADVPDNAVAAIEAAGFTVSRLGRLDDDAGHVAAARLARSSARSTASVEAAADPRADGSALVSA